MNCPKHGVKAKYLGSSSFELAYDCPEGHIFFLKIADIQDEEERRIVKFFATNPLALKVCKFCRSPKTSQEIEDMLNKNERGQRAG